MLKVQEINTERRSCASQHLHKRNTSEKRLIFYSVDISNKNTHFQAAMVVSRMRLWLLGSSLRHSLLFAQNLGTGASS